MRSWPTLSDVQRFDWLRLIRSPRVGPAVFQDLLNLYGSAGAALAALPQIAGRRGVALEPASSDAVQREIDMAARIGARFVVRGEAGYPALLARENRCPPVLCMLAKGTEVSAREGVAIVGSRNASAGGMALTRRLASDLAQAGLAVISGLARGIDAAAHLGSLEAGTIAFTAGGLARPYPPEHADLMARIAQAGGAVYSEMPLEWSARAQDFPRRNRLVAGSCLGLVVVEAAQRSGSLITARQAAEIGRLVMAVPGFPLDPRSEGPNGLIRDGATLVRDAQDVLAELGPLRGAAGRSGVYRASGADDEDEPLLREGPHHSGLPPEPDTTTEAALEQSLGYAPIMADDLIAATGLPTAMVRVWLVENELAGRIVRAPGDRFAWHPDIRR